MSMGAEQRAKLNLLHRLAEALVPVSVELGDGQLRLAAYMDSLLGTGSQAVLRLSPIAADAIPDVARGNMPVVIRGEDARGPWHLTAAHIEPENPRMARVPLRDARLDRDVPGPGPSHDVHAPLVLVVLGGVPDVESFVFPVARVGRDTCIVDVTTPLAPGTRLPASELIGDRRTLRRAPARVTTVEPWRMPDGSARFRCEVVFDDSSAREAAHAYQLLRKPAEVRRILEVACMRMAWGWGEMPGCGDGREPVRFLKLASDYALIGCKPSFMAKPLPPLVRLGFELFFAHHEMEVRPLERVDEGLKVALPLVVRRRHQARRASRVTMGPDASVRLTCRNPATGRTLTRSLEDLSFLGMSFEALPEDALWEGLPLEDAALRWEDRVIQLDDLDVIAVDRDGSRTLCRARMSKSKLAEDPDLIDLLAALGHPQVHVHRGGDYAALVDMYAKGGLLAPHMHRNFGPIADRVEDVWRRMHEKAPSVVRTLVHGTSEAPNGTVTLVRAWEHAWLAQHFVSIDPQLQGAAGKLQLATLDHVMPRPDGHFLVFFVKSDNHRMNAFYERFFASTGTPEAVGRCTLRFWSKAANGGASRARAVERVVVRRLRAMEAGLVQRASERALGPLVASAMSFTQHEMKIPDTARRFRQAGVTRSRRCRMVTKQRRPIYAIIEEQASPGFNLTWMMNAHWVIPLHGEADADGEILRRAFEEVLQLPSQSPVGDQFVIAPVGCGDEVFRRAGFQHEADVNAYALNRAGLHRYFQYTAHRYGTLDAHAVQRRARREGNSEHAP